ncbi:superoxide dismutase [Malassezia sp. CBS 17886]|nr:superoxide dismutase [Malassezia sp. CBS 17886]
MSLRAVARAMGGVRTKYTLPELPYAYDALEPAISGQIMHVHHDRHHRTYVNNLNAAEEKLQGVLAENDLEGQIALQSAINFNGGGNINHSLFWKNLLPTSQGGGKLDSGVLLTAIERDFGSLERMQELFNAQLAGIQGSGWGWLVHNPQNEQLEIITTKNQNPVIRATPLIGIDAWEHAYYLQYENNKASYFKNIWSVINYDEAENRLKAVAK